MFKPGLAPMLFPLLEWGQHRHIRPKLRVLKEDAESPFSRRRQERRRSLARILAYADSNVPYYRDLFRALNFEPSKVEKDTRYLNDLPYLTKDIIREQGPRLLGENLSRKGLHERKTGGSTGPSVSIYYSQRALDWTAAANLFVLEWTGWNRSVKELHFSSRFPERFPLKDRLKERIKCLALNRVNMVTDAFDPDALSVAWRRIRSIRPYLVQGHPSTMYALSLHVRQAGDEGYGALKVFESTGETIDPKKRKTIEDVFGCRVFDRYGNAEFGVLAHETGKGTDGLKVLDFIAWPEADHLGEGRSELVFTGLTNYAMPLVRYRTGDEGEIEERDDGFYIRNLQGRMHDLVPIGDRLYPTHYIQDLLDRLGEIDDFQIELRKDRIPLLRLVVPKSEVQGAIEARIKGWWDGNIAVEFTDFSGLRRTGWRQKYQYVTFGDGA